MNLSFLKKDKSKKIFFEANRIIKILLLSFLSALFLWSFFKLKFAYLISAGMSYSFLHKHLIEAFVWGYGVWFTDWVITLNFFINVIFVFLLIFKYKKLGEKYNFWKKYNTIYAIYLFSFYNITLFFSKSDITDLVNGHIALTSWIDHEITPGCWFIYCILDKNTLTRIDNKKIFWKKVIKESFYISLFVGAFCLYDATRTYLYINQLKSVTPWTVFSVAYSYIDYNKLHWKAFGNELIAGSILYCVCFLLMLYWNRKNKNLVVTYYKIIINSYKAIKTDPLIIFKKIKSLTVRVNSKNKKVN